MWLGASVKYISYSLLYFNSIKHFLKNIFMSVIICDHFDFSSLHESDSWYVTVWRSPVCILKYGLLICTLEHKHGTQSYEGFYSQKLHRNQQANTDGALKALSSMRTSLAVIWIFSLATVTDSSQSFQPLAAAPAGSAHTVGDMYRHSLTPASARTKHTADQQADYEFKKNTTQPSDFVYQGNKHKECHIVGRLHFYCENVSDLWLKHLLTPQKYHLKHIWQ